MPYLKAFFLVNWALLFSQGSYLTEAASLPSRADNGRTVAPANCIVVKTSGAGAGEFTSLQAAVNSIGSSTNPVCIFLNPGTYNERVDIKVKAPLTLYGSTVEYVAFFLADNSTNLSLQYWKLQGEYCHHQKHPWVV